MRLPKLPLDRFPYERDERSQPLSPDVEDGLYVYVQDVYGVIYILPDGPHMHPKVLGNAVPALYAGDMRIEKRMVVDVTNLSGTFLFDDPHGLFELSAQIEALGLVLEKDAVRFFPVDGSTPYILN